MERNTLILDASVIIKWFTQEIDKDKAIKIRDKFLKGKINILIPDLVLYELANGLRFNPNLDNEDVKEDIESIFDMNLDIVIPLSDMLNDAIELAFSKEITIYDAFYISLAKIMDFTFVTADNKLYNKIKDLGFVFLLNKFNSNSN